MDQPRPILPKPTLCLVTDLGVVDGKIATLVEKVTVAVDAGVNMVQIREPALSDAGFDDLVARVVEVTDDRVLTIVNPSHRRFSRYGDVDGFQLSENATATISQIRDSFGNSLVVGRSVHSIDGALSAAESGTDFLVFGTIFPTESHPGGSVHGPDVIRLVTGKTDVPVIGIGGISKENAGKVIGNGGRGVAVMRSILEAADPAAATRELLASMADVANAQG